MQTFQKQEVRDAIASNEYLGYELDAAKKLLPLLPVGHTDFEDVKAEMRFYALEAVELYELGHGTQFSTFLYRHLQLRSMQWKNWAWLKKMHPENAWVQPFSFHESLEQRKGKISPYDPTRVSASEYKNMQISEFEMSLSPMSRQTFAKLLEKMDYSLLPSFNKKGGTQRIADTIGVTEFEIREFANEVREKASKFIGSL